MNRDLRANLWLLVLTLLICCILYPAVLLGIGKILFADKAEGSLVRDDKGETKGSWLIAQPFSGDQYFQPRPSAVSYNAAATGGTNWGANNPALRKRVVGMLGPLLKYRDGKPIGSDIVSWTQENLRKNPAILAQWTQDDAYIAERWAAANADFLNKWKDEHTQDVERWQQENPEAKEATPADLAGLFFASYAAGSTKTWPETDGKDLQSAFFDLWWRAHPNVAFQPVPADLVMASGSGMDPHITLKGALYQLDRVASAWAKETNRDQAEVRKEIEVLLRKQAEAPLGGWAGVELVNVLEVNIALRKRYESSSAQTASLEPSKPSQAAGTSGATPSNEKTATSAQGKTTAVAVKGETPKREEGMPSLETSKLSVARANATEANGTSSTEVKKPAPQTGVEPEKPSKAAVASEKQKPADKGTPTVEPGKASTPGSIADGPALKGTEAKKPSAEPTTPAAETTEPREVPVVEKPTDTAKAPSRPPKEEKKQVTAEPDKPSKAVTAREKEKPAEERAPEPSNAASTKAASSQAAVEPQRADSAAPKVSDHADFATIVVRVPADAKVYFDDQLTQQTGEERTFVTPSLRPGRTFAYTVRTEIVSGGRVVSKTERVKVRAGEAIAVEGVKLTPAIKDR